MDLEPSNGSGMTRWGTLPLALSAFAVDPFALGGLVLRGRAGPLRQRALDALRGSLPPGEPLRRVPATIGDDRLLGGLDLVATLRAGRAVLQRGVLAELDGGVAVIAMAERLTAATAQRLAHVLDTGAVQLERDGMTARLEARSALVLLDESIEPDESVPAALRDRLAFWLDTEGAEAVLDLAAVAKPDEISDARRRLASLEIDDARLRSLAVTAAVFGVPGIRAPLLALRAARAIAALTGSEAIDDEHLRLAAELVLAPRATTLPAEPQQDAAPPPGEDRMPPSDPSSAAGADAPVSAPPDRTGGQADALAERLVEATRAALPAALLAALASNAHARGRGPQTAGRAGNLRENALRGRPLASRPGLPRGGARLDLLASLRAAAPWQRVRGTACPGRRLRLEAGDLHVKRFRERTTTMTIFAVDASGSAALHRFGEAKGAVQLLLADCYVRRDEVAVVTFRGPGAAVAVPPTRSLVRARRYLEGVPAGGGTPLASGLLAALGLAEAARRRSVTATIVVLSDGNANVGLNGIGGRQQADADSRAIARRIAAAGVATLFIDTASRPREPAARLAGLMGARYLPLPFASAAIVHAVVTQATAEAAR